MNSHLWLIVGVGLLSLIALILGSVALGRIPLIQTGTYDLNCYGKQINPKCNHIQGPVNVDLSARKAQIPITFPHPFRTLPVVSLSLGGFDLEQDTGKRISVSADEVTKTGFTLNVLTWYKNEVNSVRVTWVATGL